MWMGNFEAAYVACWCGALVAQCIKAIARKVKRMVGSSRTYYRQFCIRIAPIPGQFLDSKTHLQHLT